MKKFSAEVEINGSAEDVWRAITDASAYERWDPNMNSIEGTIGLNEKLVLHTTLSKRAFKVSVKELTPNSRMVWMSGVPMGLFKGERTFHITPRNGSVRFQLQEVFSGSLSPLFVRMIPDLHPSFLKFVQALKAEVESNSSATTAQATSNV